MYVLYTSVLPIDAKAVCGCEYCQVYAVEKWHVFSYLRTLGGQLVARMSFGIVSSICSQLPH